MMLFPKRYNWAVVTNNGEIADDHGSIMKYDSKLKLRAKQDMESLREYLEQKYNKTIKIDIVKSTRLR